MRGGALLAALALVAAPAAAQEVQPQQGSIWKGTLGASAITACFASEDGQYGVFYTDAALIPVRLEGEDDTGFSALREMRGFDDPTGAVWSLARDAGGGLAGTWRSGADTRPIRLTAHPVTLSEYVTPCETGAFLDPLLAGGTVTSRPESLDGTEYTVLDYAGPKRAGWDEAYTVTTFALDPVRPGDAVINRALAAELPDGTASHEAGWCLGSSLTSPGGSGGYTKTLTPELVTPRWVSLTAVGSSFCGGAHPGHFLMKQVFDRDSGTEVDPGTWFRKGAVGYYEFDTVAVDGRREIAGLSSRLRKAVLAHSSAGEGAEDAETRRECIDMIGDTGWHIGLTREGPVFVPQLPFVIFACTEEIVLPWAEARRFLSPEGLAVMESLR
ncbi:MAG: hypothetical protein C0486_08085 [Erythrobacter sp.]|nr:hypothetical protein [Erythrobacter sp.]MBA4080942.1 hypothetical protein [Erythrobacter sp.]